MKLTAEELATILAALRYWQRKGITAPDLPEHDIATDCGMLRPLNTAQIDRLCERLSLVDKYSRETRP